MPALEGLEGFVGLSLLVDRTSGRCIATSAWQSEDAMLASAPKIRQVRDQAADSFGGSPEVEEWEFAVMHRNHRAGEGAFVHVAWAKVDPARVDAGLEMIRTTVIPALEELDEFCGFSMLVDRARGRAVSSAAYDSMEAIDRARSQTETMSATTVRESGAEILEEGNFELAIAHLRVPELV
jgi:heme-degrading monooxygenase HmoA